MTQLNSMDRAVRPSRRPDVDAFAAYRQAERLEAQLGDPNSADSAVCFENSVRLDESESYPEDAHRWLDVWGLPEHYIPRSLGGRLSSLEEFCALVRVIARRDPSLAIGHGISWVGSLPLFLCGSEAQRRRTAEILRGGGRFAFMLTERKHGSDLQANETIAAPVDGGYELTGEKWLINNATLSNAFSLLARTGDGELSVVFVEKDRLETGTWQSLPKVRTLGVRAMDISGIALRRARVDGAAVVGERGGGFEVILRSLQVSRALSAPLCLGPLDTCLRATLDFALSRVLYRRAVVGLAHASATMTDAFIESLILDSMGIAIARGAQASTEQLAVWSSVQKFLVPTRAQRAIESLAVILGARYYLREAHWAGIFQKMLRDNAIVALFDGSTVVNLDLLTGQLPELSRRRRRESPGQSDERDARLAAMFDRDVALPEFDPSRIRLRSERDDLVDALPSCAAKLATSGAAPEVVAVLRELVEGFVVQLGALDDAWSSRAATTGSTSPESFELAKRHCLLHAASACLHVWLGGRRQHDAFFARGEWLALALSRLQNDLGGPSVAIPEAWRARARNQMLRLYAQGRQFSLVPIRLGRSRIAPSEATELSRLASEIDRMSADELDELDARLSRED